MKFSRLSFLTAVLMTFAIALIVMAFDYTKFSFDHNSTGAVLLFGISIFLILVITYIGIELLFNYYAKKQIQKMADTLPIELFSENESLGFKELSEKISGFNEQKAVEIDMMKEMENYRKEYIGNVSHELKTPLFSIQGYVETLRDGAVENLNIRDKYLDRIGISVERLIAIVNDLDMINRLEAGEINLNLTKFDINQLIREVFDLLDLEAQKKNASMKLLTTTPQIYVKADKQKINQVIINLISNAIYYANRQEATITVRTSIIKNKVCIEVKDNGMGIKQEILPRIFERFYRVETSRNRREGGSGLGLAIVKHILDAHGESISVQSEYLEGSTFRFMLEKAAL